MSFTNTLFTNDNLFILYGMDSESVDLIYLDPPFNSKRTYEAPIGSKASGTSFKDIWTWADVNKYYLEKLAKSHPLLAEFIFSLSLNGDKATASYLTYMTQRVIEMHRILRKTGSFYLHCDPTASHYIKIMLDEIFGKKNFRNEIIWAYTGPSGSKRNFPKKHDVIFRYSKTDDYKFYPDAIRISYKKLSTGKTHSIFKEDYELDPNGKVPEDWWRDIPSGGNISPKERTGYATQKPLALLHRIIKASSEEGDIVLDPFCGCATACVASQQLNRKWIGIDIEDQAPAILIKRLSDDAGLFKDFVHRVEPPKRTDLASVKISSLNKKLIKDTLYANQEGKCNGCLVDFYIINLEIDHIVPKSKGGGDYMENYQLLCGFCNKQKGDRPMHYLLRMIKARTDILRNKLTFDDE